MSIYCTKCPLYLTSFTNDKKHKVICLSGCGSKSAKIMLIGEAPGNDELFKKEPFVGKAGKELDKCLKEAGINRAEIFLSNSCRCRPPDNRDPNTKELKACREFLVNEINSIKPNVIGLLGNIAMKQVLGKTGSLKYQGQPFWSDEFQVTCIPLIHPSYIIRNQDNMEVREKFINALKFVKEASKTKNPIKRKVSPVKYVVCDNMNKVKALFSRLAQVKEVTIDTESTCLRPYNGKLLCISFSWKSNTAIVLPILDRNLKRCWNNAQYSWILKKFGEFTSRKGVKKIFQNGKYDIQWFKYHLGIGVGINFDTMLAHYVLNQSGQRSSHKLKEMAWTYTDMGNYSENIDASKFGNLKYIKEHYDDILQYACADADCTFRIYRKLLPQIKKEKMEFVLYKIMLPQSTVLASIELNGVQIDRRKLEQLKVKYGNNLKETETKLYAIAEIKSVTNKQYKIAVDKQKKKYQDSKIIKKRCSLKEYLDKVERPKFNFNSHQQLADLFYRALKMPKPEKTKKGTALSTDKKTLEKLKDKHPIINLILEYKRLTKMYNTYICPTFEGLDENDRIHTEYNQHITATGRLSSSKPNLQNVPKEYGKDFRDCFIAKEGYKLLSADSCLPEDSKISTIRGLIPIQNICVGDRVYTDNNNKLSLVSKIIDQGFQDTIKITTNMGYELEATKTHRIRILNKEGEYIWKDINKIDRNKDYVVIQPRKYFAQKKKLTLPKIIFNHFNNKIVSVPKIVNTDLAQFMGYLTGDGSLGSQDIKLTLCSQDIDLIKKMELLIEKLFKIIIDKDKERKGAIDLRIHSKPLLKWLCNIGASKKSVPKYLWVASFDIIAAYLRGLFEADGSVQSNNLKGGRVSFSTISENLAKEVQQLLLLLNIPSRRNKFNHSQAGFYSNHKYIYYITIPTAFTKRFQKGVNFISKRKKQKLFLLSKKVGYSSFYGGMPNLKNKALDFKFKGKVQKLLNNTSSLGRQISLKLAYKISRKYPQIAKSLGLYHITKFNQIFDKITKIEFIGKKHVYDLSIPNTLTYISNGFINHNCQIEFRVLAHLSADQRMIADIKSGKDIHTITATRLYRVKEEDVTKEQRDKSKPFVFGIPYGRGAKAIAEQYGLTVEEAEEQLRYFNQIYPRASRWNRAVIIGARTHRYVKNWFGRKRPLPFINDKNKELREKEERKVVATSVQGTASDIIGLQMIEIYKRLKKINSKSKIVLTIHDDIVLEVSEIDIVSGIIKEEMSKAPEGFKVPLDVDIKIGERWGSMVEPDKFEED